MAYTKDYTLDAGPAGDTVKDAITVKVDGNIDAIFADLNTHEALTTGAHGVGSGTIVGTALTQTLTNKTISGGTLTGSITADSLTLVGYTPTFSGNTLTNATLTGTITASGATWVGLDTNSMTNGTINGATLSGTITGTLAALTNATLTGTITATGATWVGLPPATDVTNGTITNCTITGTITATGATWVGLPAATEITNGTITNSTLTGTITGTSAILQGVTLSGTVTASGATFVGANKMAGHTIQTLYTFNTALATSTTAIPVDGSIPQINEGALAATCAITPTATNNLLCVRGILHMGCATANKNHVGAIFSGTTSNAVSAGLLAVGNNIQGSVLPLEYITTAVSTATVTYTIRYGCSDGTALNLNGFAATALVGATQNSGLIVSEVAV